ncbi:MAG: STAS domain-containing protein [Planctomycetia bacterium]|nr:STAS domain-containing protein [Planctomycetia bacterium]
MPQLNITENGDVVVVSFVESKILDESMIRQIGEEFKKLTTEAAAERKLLVKFSGVGFMSSSMIGQVMRLSKQCKADKVELKLSDIAPAIMEVFKLTRLDKILAIHATEAEAIKAFGPARKSWFGRS